MFCPHSVFMCFVWISKQTAIISLYSINWLVFITETECVYCAVRTGSLNIIQAQLGRAISQAVSCRVLTADDLVLSQASVCEIWMEEVALGQGFLPVIPFSTVSIILPVLHIYVRLYVALTRRTSGRSLVTFRKQVLFRKSGSIG
jgi:hypothetical protein